MFGVFKKYKTDFYILCLLSAIFFSLVPIFYAKAGYPFIDSARELWYPQLMLEGKLLYKDILNLYGPLSYQINALIYHLFGIKSDNLFNMGFFVSYLIMILSYVIARIFSKPSVSFVATFMTFVLMFRFVFTGFNFSTYYFPYSYAILYSLFFCLCTLICVLTFFKTKNKYFLLLASLFIGIDFITKFDFIGFDIFIFLFILFNKSLNIKDKFISVLIFILPILVSFGFLFHQGVTVDDLQKSLKFLRTFSNANSVNIYNHYHMGMYFTWEHFEKILHYSKMFFGFFIYYFLLAFLTVYIFRKSKILSVVFLIFAWKILFHDQSFVRYMTDPESLCFVPYIFFIVVLSLLYKFWLKKEFISENQKIFNFTVICALLLNLRYFWFVFINAGANFSILLYIILMVIYFLENAKSETIKNGLALFFVLVASCFLFNSIQASGDYHSNIDTTKGVWYFNTPYGKLVKSSVDFVFENTDIDDTVMMVPESPVLSWYTGRKSYMDLYSLIPHFIDAYGETWILNKIRKDKPKVILISSGAHHPPFGDNWFGNMIGQNIYRYILNNYDYVKTEEFEAYDSNWEFNIRFYKLRE